MRRINAGSLHTFLSCVLVSLAAPLVDAASTVAVTDEEGQPIPKFEAMLNTADQGCTAWQHGTDGTTQFWETFTKANVVDVLVRADGYASTIARFAGAEHDKLASGQAAVRLKPGQAVELRLGMPEGMTWPADAKPDVYFRDIADRARMMRQPSARTQYEKLGAPVPDFNVKTDSISSGSYRIRLADDTPPFFVAVHAVGFLQSFEVGPFTLADVKDGVLEIPLPRPARLDVHFRPPTDLKATPYNAISLMVLSRFPGTSRSFLEVARETSQSMQLDYSLNDLAPGDYRVTVRTQPDPAVDKIAGTEINPGTYNDVRMLSLVSGQTEQVDFAYSPPNLNAYQGDRTAELHIELADGTPAAGKSVAVEYADGHYGAIPVFSGEIPESGTITIQNLTERTPPDWPHGPYAIRMGEKRLGSFKLSDTAAIERFVFRMPPEAGDKAPGVTFTNVATGHETGLADFRGKVVWLEFWATWCGPCQQPTQELVAMATKHGDDWKDQVAIVPLSVDDDAATLNASNARHGWDTVAQYWVGAAGTQSGWDAPVVRAFGIEGVPTAFLIDRDGRIVWRGHPMDNSNGQNVESRINAAIDNQ